MRYSADGALPARATSNWSKSSPRQARRALSRADARPTEEQKKQIAGNREARLAELARIRKQKDEIQKQKSNRRRGPDRR